MQKIFFIVCCIVFAGRLHAQTFVYPSSPQHIERAALINVRAIYNDFAPVFYSLEMPHPGAEAEELYGIELKNTLYKNKKYTGSKTQRSSADVPEPAILHGFTGNPMGSGVPNDNDVAISNAGILISVINSSIYIYDSENEDTLLKTFSLGAFSDTLDLPASDYDPRVVYDPIHDKFVLVFLNGYTPASSYIILAFSQTNDPLGLWNLYKLPGNPKDNDLWTDYPMIALTESEVFLTGNLIIPDEPWQTGFSETLIWQMKLDSGYAGTDLHAVYWDSIYHGGYPIRNLCPVKGGSNPHGPDMYFLSNRNFSESNDTIFVVHITGVLDDELTTAAIDLSLSDKNYGVPPFARQYNEHEFDTNDGRVLEAFQENGQIQFVSNTIDPSTGFCGIYHGVITGLGGDMNISAQIIGDDTLDLGYPDISYTGNFSDDIQSIITCDHTAPNVNAGMSGFFYNYGTYSNRVNIFTGETYVNVISGTYERWGDYSGSQRKYNETGVVWVSGNYGHYHTSGPFTYHDNATRIAKLKSNDSLPLPVADNIPEPVSSRVYPNPFANTFSIDLDVPFEGEMHFILLNAAGQKIKELLVAEASAGKNRFSFSTIPLGGGTYFLQMELNGKIIATEKVIKQ